MIDRVTVETCLAFAVTTEKLGAELYQRLAQKFAADGQLRELFEELGRDEARHEEQVAAMGERLVARVRGRPLAPDEQAYLRAWSTSEVFSGPGGLTSDLGAIQGRLAHRHGADPRREGDGAAGHPDDGGRPGGLRLRESVEE